MEAPRAPRPQDRESLDALTAVVFRPGMLNQYPQLFDQSNYENLRVVLEDGKCVSHVGMIERDAALFGCRIKTCCIGSVGTLPEYRGKGYAGACLDAITEKAITDGVDVMIVSGDRNLYRMRGCLHVGHDLAFRVAADAIPPALNAPGITVDAMTEANLPLVMDCYRREPVRFMRPPDDYRWAVESRRVMNRPSDFLVVRDVGDFRGYLVVQEPDSANRSAVVELAGDRHALLAAMPLVIRRFGSASVSFPVLGHDALFQSLCEQAGLTGEPRPTPGTVTILNFPQLLEHMRPHFAEILGARISSGLAFRQEDEQRVFVLEGERLVADRDTATRMVFGSADGPPAELSGRPGALGEALRAIFPLPTLWYGINYV